MTLDMEFSVQNSGIDLEFDQRDLALRQLAYKDSVSYDEITNKPNIAMIEDIPEAVDGLQSEDKNKPLSANQGRVLKQEIDQLYTITKDTVYTKTETEDTYKSRPTAGGLNVIDGTNATLKKIEGNTVRSKNLFDFSKFYIADNCTNTELSNNSVTTKGNISSNNQDNAYSKGWVKFGDTRYVNTLFHIEQNVNYTVSFDYTILELVRTNCCIVYVNNQDNTLHISFNFRDLINGKNRLTFTFNAPTTRNVQFVFTVNSNKVKIENIQLEQGSTATPYTPYFDGLKHSKVKSLTSTGKNLFDISKANDYGMINNGDGSLTVSEYPCRCGKLKVLCPTLKAGDVVNFSFATDGYHQGILNGNNVIYFNKSGTTLTITNEMLNFDVCFYRKVDGNPATISNVLVEYGTTKTSFEPYIEPSKIELEEPIECGLGTTIDFENGKVINQYKEIVLTGNERCDNYPSYENSVVFPNILGNDTSYYMASGICTDVGLEEVGNLGTNYSLRIGVNNGSVYWIKALSHFGLSDSIEFKQYLATRYASGNPVIIRYIANEVQSIQDINIDNKYKVYKNGLEIVENENDTWVDNTLTQEYFTKVGGEDES